MGSEGDPSAGRGDGAHIPAGHTPRRSPPSPCLRVALQLLPPLGLPESLGHQGCFFQTLPTGRVGGSVKVWGLQGRPRAEAPHTHPGSVGLPATEGRMGQGDEGPVWKP